MVCTSLGSLLHPLFYFLCSNLKANPVLSLLTVDKNIYKMLILNYNFP